MIKIIIEKPMLKFMVEYINSIKKLFKFDLIIYDNEKTFKYNFKVNEKYIFVYKIPKKIKNYKKNFFLLNTEQLSKKKNLNNINILHNNLNIIDYSMENLNFIKNKEKFYLPYQINYEEIYNFEKSKNVCMMWNQSPKRQFIIDALKKKNIITDIIKGYGNERDNILFKYKIILNISYDDTYNIFESIRCDRCIYNKMIVISDKKINFENYYLNKYIIFEDYDKLVEKVEFVLNNYNKIHNDLFTNLSFNKIEKNLIELSNKTINRLVK